MSTQHSSLPEKIVDVYLQGDDGITFRCSREQRHFVEVAVNAHDELLAAAKEIVDIHDEKLVAHSVIEFLRSLKAAIAKAEAVAK